MAACIVLPRILEVLEGYLIFIVVFGLKVTTNREIKIGFAVFNLSHSALQMSSTAPTPAEGDVADYYVHEFQHTDIMQRVQAQPGQKFVRALPSKCVIHFEEGDVDVPDWVRALAGPGLALDTEWIPKVNIVPAQCTQYSVHHHPEASWGLLMPGC